MTGRNGTETRQLLNEKRQLCGETSSKTSLLAAGDSLDVIIIGAGISGIGMAIKFGEKFPKSRIKIIERGSVLGGTLEI
jgi:ribulose 1,5-bisphosphate synthetase/thiazole synthase